MNKTDDICAYGATSTGFRFAPDSSGGEGIDVFPVEAPAELLTPTALGKILCCEWPELVRRAKSMTLRELADECGVSHEAVRRTLQLACSGVMMKEP